MLTASTVALADKPLELARDGKSGYTFVHAESAPASVKLAARELQRVVKVATGAELPVDSKRTQGPAILVGAVDGTPGSTEYDV